MHVEVREEGASKDKDQDTPQESSCTEPAVTHVLSSYPELRRQAVIGKQGQSYGPGVWGTWRQRGGRGAAGQARADSGWKTGQRLRASTQESRFFEGTDRRGPRERKERSELLLSPAPAPLPPGDPWLDSWRRAPGAPGAVSHRHSCFVSSLTLTLQSDKETLQAAAWV